MFDQTAAQYMLTMIESGLTYVREGSGQHAPGTVTHHHGEPDHMAHLERPFHQAGDAIRRRAREAGVAL